MDELVIHPNFHAILLHVPLGLLAIGVLIELLTLFSRGNSFQSAGRWMILLGTLACVPAITSGIYAFRAILTADANLPWHQVLEQHGISPRQWESLLEHLRYSIAGTAVLVVVVMTFLASSDLMRRQVQWTLRAILAVGVSILAIGAWQGTEMVYRQGLSVNTRVTRSHPATETPATIAIERVFPPTETHVLAAGIMIALTLVAFALTIRSITHAGEIAPNETRILNMEPVNRVPSSRFWLLVSLIAALVGLSGWWVLSSGTGHIRILKLWDIVVRDESYRRVAHVAGGAVVLALMLLLAILTRVASRNAFLLGLFSSLLVLMIAAQVWLGVLMLYDTPHGPVNDFNPVTTPVAPTPPRADTRW